MSKFCAGSFTYPDPFTKEEEFIDCLVTKVTDLGAKVLIPTHDEGIIIARHRNRFPESLIILVESADKLLTLSNKRLATDLAKRAGVPVPVIYNSTDDVKTFPIVFKTVVGNSAKGVFFPASKAELDSLAIAHSNEDTMIEEWIKGEDVCVDCIRYGTFFYASVYRALITKTDGGGTTTQRQIIDMPQLVDYARTFLDYVDYNGVCGLDFRYDSDSGRVAFIEMNARFTGGIATPIAAGFDIPYVLYSLAVTGRYDAPINLKIGTSTKWILGDIITLTGRLLSFNFSKNELRRIIKFSGFDGFDDFRSDDKKAILGEFYYYLLKLLKNRKLNP